MNMRYVSHEMDKTARYLTVSVRGPWWKLWRRFEVTVYQPRKDYADSWRDLDTGESYKSQTDRAFDGLWFSAIQREVKLDLLLEPKEESEAPLAYSPGTERKLRALNGGK